MNQKGLALVLVAIACVATAGTGAYIALRQDAAPAATSAAVETLSDRTAAASLPSAAVNETEAVLSTPPSAETIPVSRGNDQATASPGRAAGAGRSANHVEGRTTPRRPVQQGAQGVTAAPPARPAAPARSPSNEIGRQPAERPAPAAPTSEQKSLPEEALPEPAEVAAPAVSAGVTSPQAPERVLEELTVPAESVIGLQIENSITSERARIEDQVEARVTRDVRADGRVAIPAGSRMQGSVTLVERGGKVKERARLGVRFHTLVLADGLRLPVHTETIYRDGDSPTGESAAKIGGAAVGGAILGAILGGGKGAAIGGSIGAAGGTAAVMAGDRNPATLQAGSTVTVRLQSPVTVTVED